jgi:LysM repeat protein
VHVILSRQFIVLAASLLLLVACTRERPLPDPTATSAVPEVVRAAATATTSPDEPQVTPEAAVGPTATLAPTETPTPEVGETIPYVVQPGDTLAGIAVLYGTDVETLRRINNLTSDALLVGQPLYVPIVEGVVAPGLPEPTPGPVEYVIQPGDTLTGIALLFGVDPIAIQERNNILDPDNLTVGATIIIPGAQPLTTPAAGETTPGEPGATAPAGGGIVHIVQAGESLSSIAVTYGVDVAEIAAANGLGVDDVLRIGQELIIPGISARDAAAAQGNVHVVKEGESLFGIAVLYNVTVEEIIAANELTNPDTLVVGQELIIPRR